MRHAPDAPRIDQGTIIPQLQMFAKISNYDWLKADEIESGVCHGCSVSWSCEKALGQGDVWEAKLRLVPGWPGTKESLSQEVCVLSGSQAERFTYQTLLESVAYSLVRNQAGSKVSLRLFGAKKHQWDYLRPGSFFSSERGGIQFYQSFAGYFDLKSLCDLLEMLKNKLCGPAMILLADSEHVCSLFYDRNNSSWYFYDSNNPLGKITFENAQLLALAILKNNEGCSGKSFSINVASWQKDVLVDDSDRRKFYAKHRMPFLLKGAGFHMILRYAEDQLPAAFLERTCLIEAIKAEGKNRGTGLHSLANDRPECLEAYLEFILNYPMAFELGGALENSILNAIYDETNLGIPRCILMSRAFAKTLLAVDCFGETGLHAIVEKGLHVLPQVIALAKRFPDVQIALLKALITKNNKGNAPSFTIVHKSPKLLRNEIICLVSESNVCDNGLKISVLVYFLNLCKARLDDRSLSSLTPDQRIVYQGLRGQVEQALARVQCKMSLAATTVSENPAAVQTCRFFQAENHANTNGLQAAQQVAMPNRLG